MHSSKNFLQLLVSRIIYWLSVLLDRMKPELLPRSNKKVGRLNFSLDYLVEEVLVYFFNIQWSLLDILIHMKDLVSHHKKLVISNQNLIRRRLGISALSHSRCLRPIKLRIPQIILVYVIPTLVHMKRPILGTNQRKTRILGFAGSEVDRELWLETFPIVKR